MKSNMRIDRADSRARGFSLIEISIVLVVIGIILSITISGVDVYRSAQGLKAYTDFIQGWVASYRSYVSQVNAQPGDDPGSPLGRVVGADGGPVLCDSDTNRALSNVMLQRAVTLPQGRSQNEATRYVYQDKNGYPHELQICIATVGWSIPGSSVGTYQIVQKTVLDIRGLTPQLAYQVDAMVDTRVTGNQGDFRDATLATDTSGQVMPWSLAPNATMNGAAGQETQSAELEGYLLLN
ncbi:type II secretion system protein [Burkholderia gladioli]|uniref:type II secretion system protein n=1 Tax=Burkholderia gladioli TaxID=28095 RepID=UPI00163FCE1E|nr:prepilin-type N-terminal cleavage/methylation domain-containing protein [Burkholderia gladioli]